MQPMSKGTLRVDSGFARRMTGATTLSNRLLFAGSLAILGYGVLASSPQVQNRDTSAIFEAKIRPLLDAKCVACHGAKQQLKGVRLDKPITADVAQRLADAIAYTGEVRMPPAGKLPADELAALTAWAKAGAPWPTTAAPVKPKGTFWSFVPPKRPPLPKVKASTWGQNPIDRFILAKLEAKGLKPAPVADRRTLIRRATFDLTGLPPTPPGNQRLPCG